MLEKLKDNFGKLLLISVLSVGFIVFGWRVFDGRSVHQSEAPTDVAQEQVEGEQP